MGWYHVTQREKTIDRTADWPLSLGRRYSRDMSNGYTRKEFFSCILFRPRLTALVSRDTNKSTATLTRLSLIFLLPFSRCIGSGECCDRVKRLLRFRPGSEQDTHTKTQSGQQERERARPLALVLVSRPLV